MYLPPFRVQGVSIAGESTCVMVPELDVCFDMGSCPRAALASKLVAVSHGHMDHIGALAYYCSQRKFQGMPPGIVVCHAEIERPIRRMMEGYHDLERQVTPYELIALAPGAEVQIKNNMFLRLFDVDHTCPAAGYVVVERRSKLREEFVGLPQEKLRELKQRGMEITHTLEVPLVAYLGDTAPGGALLRRDVLGAQVVICECTFIEPDHVKRAEIGKHLHIDNVAEWLPLLQGDALVLTHLSRRSNIPRARKRLADLVGFEKARKVHFLMDARTNRERYERQAGLIEGRESAGAL